MFKRYTVMLAAGLFWGCAGPKDIQVLPLEAQDAGLALDAGLDAGPPDSGLSEVDAGTETPDAGAETPDAGVVCGGAKLGLPLLGSNIPWDSPTTTVSVQAVADGGLDLVSAAGKVTRFEWMGPPLPFAVGQQVTLSRNQEWTILEAGGTVAAAYRAFGFEFPRSAAGGASITPLAGGPNLAWEAMGCSFTVGGACGAPPQNAKAYNVAVQSAEGRAVLPVETGVTLGDWQVTHVTTVAVPRLSYQGCSVEGAFMSGITMLKVPH